MLHPNLYEYRIHREQKNEPARPGQNADPVFFYHGRWGRKGGRRFRRRHPVGVRLFLERGLTVWPLPSLSSQAFPSILLLNLTQVAE